MSDNVLWFLSDKHLPLYVLAKHFVVGIHEVLKVAHAKKTIFNLDFFLLFHRFVHFKPLNDRTRYGDTLL